jgi:hypothetical protein
MLRKVSLQTTMIACVSVSVTLLSAAVAFAGLANQSLAIHVIAVSALIYGVAFAWLESGYVLLRSDSALPAPAVYSLFAIIRVAVFLSSGLLGVLFNVSELPVWKFMLISAGLSSGAAVISCLRTGKMDAIGFAYLTGVLMTLVVAVSLRFDDAVLLLYAYALLTLVPSLLVALWSGGTGWAALSKSLFATTRSFIVDLPVTSIVENGDRILLSQMADHRVLIAYNATKVFFGIQREFNKLLKQLMFHHIFDEVKRGGASILVRRYFVMVCATQILTLLAGVAVFIYFNNEWPHFADVYVALCVSTAFTLTASHTVAVAMALHRPSHLFTSANMISLAVALLATTVLMAPTMPSFVQPETVYVVAGCYLLFYAVKTVIVFSFSLRKLVAR